MKGINPNELNIVDNNTKSNNEILWNPFDKKNIKIFSDNMLNTYYSNMIFNSKIGESFIDSIILIGINSTISSNNDINDSYNKKIKENDDIYNLIKNSLEEKNYINIRNTGHHRSSSSMNEKIFQQQKLKSNDINEQM